MGSCDIAQSWLRLSCAFSFPRCIEWSSPDLPTLMLEPCQSSQPITFLFLSSSRALPDISMSLRGYPSLKHSNIASVAICLYFLLTFIRYCRAVWPLTKYIVDNFSSIILHSNDFYANVQILLHSFLMNSLRDDDYIALQQPVQGYLCSSLAVFLAYLGEGRVGSGSTW